MRNAKLTLELPSDLLRRVQARAVEQDRSMDSIVVEALEALVRRGTPSITGWRAVFGRAKQGWTRDVDRRVHASRGEQFGIERAGRHGRR